MVVLLFLSTIFTFLLSYALCKVSDITLRFWTVCARLLLKNPVKKEVWLDLGALKESEWAIYSSGTEKRSTTIPRNRLSLLYIENWVLLFFGFFFHNFIFFYQKPKYFSIVKNSTYPSSPFKCLLKVVI